MKQVRTKEQILASPPDQVAPLILELDQLQEDQLKADILAYYAEQNTGSFASLNSQKHRDKSARRQDRSIELQKELETVNYEYKPLEFTLDFYITPFYSEKELRRFGNPGQKYRTEPSLKRILGDKWLPQSGCLHTVKAATLLEGSEKAKAEHLEKCLTK